MTPPDRSYVPAAGHGWALPFYDPLTRLLGVDAARRALVEQAALRPAQRVLDIGCGTGRLIVLVAHLHPDVEVVGLDPDPKALARARRKVERAGVSVQLDRGFADALPYAPASFDRVFSSFMLHHLEPTQKVAALREVRRVLEPGGALHLLDFGGAGPGPRGVLARMLHSGERLRDNFGGRIPVLMTQAGLADAREVGHRAMLFRQIAYYRATA